MRERLPYFFKKASTWLVASVTLLFVSLVFYLYDASHSEDELIAQIQNHLQEDLEDCLSFYGSPIQTGPEETSGCEASRLVYNQFGRLSSWTNTAYLPAQQYIDRINDISNNAIVVLQENRHYYQIRKEGLDSTVVYLIPLYIDYDVNNEFLLPYVFLGTYQGYCVDPATADYLRQLEITVGESTGETDLMLKDLDGNIILKVDNVPVHPFRIVNRYIALFALIFGLLFLGIFLRIYTLKHNDQRYWVDAGLFFGILGFRSLLYALNFPGDYIDSDLFSPSVLAFHDLAPSLGELTLNIFTFAALVFILYLSLIRFSNVIYRRIILDHYIAWSTALLMTVASSFLLYWYQKVFQSITVNSQVDIEFSNIFKTNIFSYLILLDVGVLLLALLLVMTLLLRLNALYIRRYRRPIGFLVFQIGSVLLCNLYMYQDEYLLGLISAIVILGLLLTIYRVPFRSLLRHNLVNYLMLILVITILVTYNVIQGVSMNTQLKATQIAERVLGSQAANTVFSFAKSTSRINADLEDLKLQYQTLADKEAFRDWMSEKYLTPNFKEFEVCLFIYHPDSTLLASYDDKDPVFGPDADIPIEDRGERISPDANLFQIPNSENKSLDLYVGRFELNLGRDSLEKLYFLMELKPTSRESQDLYTSLALDQNVYEDLKLINSFDYAIYRDGILYSKRGESSFPIRMSDHKNFSHKANRIRGDYHEYLEPIGKGKLVVVRYPKMKLFEVITTFSFIFYFYVLASLVLIALPVWVLRLLRDRPIMYSIPLRSKIRFGLLSISFLPMLVIIVMLYPFVSQRYYEDAKRDLLEEAARISDVLEQDFQKLQEDVFGRVTQVRKFQERVKELESTLRNNINIYDRTGKQLASTQPLIAQNGIYTDLMNREVFEQLKKGDKSDLVIEEKIGSLSYLSAYRPFVGSNGRPAGYVNIPYLAKQDQLEEQVIDFLAYLANIYLIVFLMLNVVAVIVSNTITQPLALVQQRLSETGLGGKNEPIQYFSKDEIGDIVSAYNQMVDQLDASEEKLAQNEREMAWRQMARQVAHEIKNPLTPMRLSIQHLNRAWKNSSDKLEQMFPKVVNTLLVQIDSLVRIANSFSEFAKMPEPVKVHVKVNEVLLEVVDLYTQAEDVIWLIDIPNEPFWCHADRDQLSRCFNNIIKNGLQAIDENGIMHVSMRILKDRTRIEIKDNGKGMSEEVQKRIFEPSFSTKTSGMGLGLAIVKKIIENLGGDITFRSVLNVGTTFIIELPSIEAERNGVKELGSSNEMA